MAGRHKAFSLVEVVVAVGVFAIAIISVLGVLAPVSRSVSDSMEADVAVRLAENIQTELKRVGFNQVVASLTGASPLISLAATADGSKVSSMMGAIPPADINVDGSNPALPVGIYYRDRFFLVEVTPLPAPLTYNTANPGGFMAVAIKISWPYYLPLGPQKTPLPASANAANTYVLSPPENRSIYLLNTAVTP